MNEYPKLDALLGRSRIRRSILDLMVAEPDTRRHLSEIARAVGTSPGTASRELQRLENAGLVTRTREGAQVYHQARLGSPILEAVRTLLHEATIPSTQTTADPMGLSIARRLAADLRGIYGGRLRGVYLYGSRARGDHRPDSDVDVLVVLDRIDEYGSELRRSSGTASELSLEHGVTVTRMLVPETVWLARERPVIQAAANDAIAV